ncbi:hypothetical protein F5B19DRAFT_245634 [Rostrohypoxylon terebratum]|nr:hypothetical protein F5B19DRAFT_245634 [Rostrohypoxylon terebratum]
MALLLRISLSSTEAIVALPSPTIFKGVYEPHRNLEKGGQADAMEYADNFKSDAKFESRGRKIVGVKVRRVDRIVSRIGSKSTSGGVGERRATADRETPMRVS